MTEPMSLHGKSSRLLIRQESPFNGGPPPDELRRTFVTPNDLFFVRNHGEVPAVDAVEFRLEVKGAVRETLALSLADLATFPRHEVTATIQCAGNRRSELAAAKPIPHELRVLLKTCYLSGQNSYVMEKSNWITHYLRGGARYRSPMQDFLANNQFRSLRRSSQVII